MATKPDDDGPNTSGGPSATLSRSTLYASLAAYNQDQVEPGTYMRNLRSNPKSTQDASLVDFWQKVSEDYHRFSDNTVAKNTAGRPLSTQEVSDRIKLRTLTLVGGGINTAASSTRKVAAKSERQRRRAKRRRVENETLNDQAVVSHQLKFLKDLNSMWVDYIWSLVQTTAPSSDDEGAALVARIKTLQNVEWVGARVRIEECKHRRSYERREGILISTTSETFRLVEIDGNKERREDKQEEASKEKSPLKTLIVPNKNSRLSVLLALPATKAESSPSSPKTDRKRHIRITLQDTS